VSLESSRSVRLVSPGWPPSAFQNGIVTYTSRLVPAMRGLGCDARVLTWRLGEPDPPEWVRCVGRPGLAWRQMARAGRRLPGVRGMVPPDQIARLRHEVRAMTRRGECGLVEMEESFGHPRFLSGRAGVPVVVRLHGPWFVVGDVLGVSHDARFDRRVELERVGILAADGVTAPSQDILDRTRRHYGIDLPDAMVIPGQIDPVPGSLLWDVDAAEPGLIVFVGRFDRVKGGDVMLDAFASIASRCARARLIFIGPDRGVDVGGQRESFSSYTERVLPACARARVEYAGTVPYRELGAYRRRASVVVMASRYENFGNVVLEAVSLGCPFVGTRSGGTPEIVMDGRTGLLAEPGDAEGLAQRIAELLEDRERAARLGAEAALDAERRFHPDVIARQTLEYYARVIERSER